MDEFFTLMKERFACKRYADKPIPPSVLTAILEFGRLSPTSFGLEGWRFHVVTDSAVRQSLVHACFGQEQVVGAPVTIVITALTASSFDPHGSFVGQRGSRFPGTLEEFIADYEGYHRFLEEEGRLDCWSRAQCYIAAANMMTGAASMGIQSCAIEGFDESLIAESIDLDTSVWQVALAVTFGYPGEPERKKIREPLENLVEYH